MIIEESILFSSVIRLLLRWRGEGSRNLVQVENLELGMCISSASFEIYQAEDGLENVLHFQENIACNGTETLGSLYSKEGSKGLNQDSAILHLGYGMESGAFCGVFDGHGKSGLVVSRMVRDGMPFLLLSQMNSTVALAKVQQTVEDGNNENTESGFEVIQDFQEWKEAFASAFKAMDKEIKLQENLDCSCSGTTVAVAVRQDDDLVIANLGNCRAVLGTINGNGLVPIKLTTDMKPGVSSEADRIKKCNGRGFALKEEPHIEKVWLPNEDSPGLAMTRSFGDFLLKNYGVIALPEITYRRFTPNDQLIVLAIDGVWDVLSNNQVASILWEANSEQAVVEAAAATWKRRFPSSKVDDCTAVCLFLQKRHQQCSSPFSRWS